MADEVWLPVVGFEGYYEVSDLGRVRRDARARDWRSRGETLKPVRQKTGYYHVLLSVRGHITGRTVHSLVMEAFVGPRPPGYETNHKDGKKANCRLGNLEYLTIRDNRLHAVRTGLRKLGAAHWTHQYPVGHTGACKLTPADAKAISAASRAGESQYSLAARYGVSRTTIYKIIHGKSHYEGIGAGGPTKAQTHLNDQQVREMVACVEIGEAKTVVARRFGVSRAFLYKVLDGRLRGSATGR